MSASGKPSYGKELHQKEAMIRMAVIAREASVHGGLDDLKSLGSFEGVSKSLSPVKIHTTKTRP
jgi:hypothetical protein